MIRTDVVVAGGGIAGLLIASALAPSCSVLLLEQGDSLPQNKYWLTEQKAADRNPHLAACIDRCYNSLDFVAYDGLSATVRGSYCLWDTERLVSYLARELSRLQARVLTGHRLYAFSQTKTCIIVRANAEEIQARLLIDCMGFGSPIVGAKDVATIIGYYILHGCEARIKLDGGDVRPICLDNVIVDRRPTFFELFPTSKGTAHAAIILPSRQYKPARSIKSDLSFILCKSHYSKKIMCEPFAKLKSYFGIIPVGRLRTPVLERIVFFGEAGQINPATTATGLTRMLHTYSALAASLLECLERDSLRHNDLIRAIPEYMTPMNRVFQESLFEKVLSYNSDDFRLLVQELREYPDNIVNDLMFGEFDFRPFKTVRLAANSLLRRRGVLGPNILRSLARFLSRRRSL
jgi:flavin-dependent dehydrogenase